MKVQIIANLILPAMAYRIPLHCPEYIGSLLILPASSYLTRLNYATPALPIRALAQCAPSAAIAPGVPNLAYAHYVSTGHRPIDHSNSHLPNRFSIDMRIIGMATTTTTHPHTKDEEKDKDKKEPAKPQGQIDAERAEKGGDVPEEEQGKPNQAREWTATERERERRADRAKFESEYNAKLAAKDAKASAAAAK